MIVALISAVLSALGIFGGFVFLKRQITSSVGAERETLLAGIPKAIDEIDAILAKSAGYASKPQLEFLLKQTESAEADIQKEKENLKGIESRLDQAQKNVETRESTQQQLKTAHEDEENKLHELLAKFETISAESVSLEQKLATSMKNLDQLMEEVELTPDQRGAMQDLSNALTGAGSRLRELLMEYTTVKERLQSLRQQHSDLEEEYTRLVEQQLGE